MPESDLPTSPGFLDDREQWHARIGECLDEAKRLGAAAAEAAFGLESGLSVSVRMGEVETVEHTRDRGLGITVYFPAGRGEAGLRKGSASTSDLSPGALHETVKAACEIARYTAPDPYAGLAPPELMAGELPELDLYHPWELTVEAAIDLALRCESAARHADPRIVNSEGASLDTEQAYRLYGNSHGFLGGYPGSRHGLSCAVIARDAAGMQRDYWYTSARHAEALEAAEAVGARAAERTLARLDARRLSTRQVPVVFAPEIAASLFGHFLAAISGGSLYRRASFLLDALGKPVFAPTVNIHERPHLPRAAGSAPFDAEGVGTRARDLVRGGVLEGYVLDSYAGRRLGMQSTGNAGGVHNLVVEPGPLDLAGLLREMGTGLLVTELMGQGVNGVTGDYSRGAAGFWIENGEIAYPVEEFTVAGNLADMYRGIRGVGRDVDTRGNIRTGSVLIERMTVAGE